MLDLGPHLNTARLHARKGVPPELQPVYDELCASIIAGIEKHGTSSYGVIFVLLAELVRLGWRPSAPPTDEIPL